LIHNPNSHQAWVDLADHIDQTKDMALNDAAKLVSREAWGRSVEAASLVQKLRLALRRYLLRGFQIQALFAGCPE